MTTLVVLEPPAPLLAAPGASKTRAFCMISFSTGSSPPAFDDVTGRSFVDRAFRDEHGHRLVRDLDAVSVPVQVDEQQQAGQECRSDPDDGGPAAARKQSLCKFQLSPLPQ